ncbi:hypothetical protein LAZ67_2006315 [Cordylochernes scorpioides]|uniref:Mos1 transposase HTH domain-containing protein n=1 Tax=Cordylochernes scorpioides TaxID=51811 RepID=A0ABY6K5D4_9ARAC|nr:hypothetical protein LAZ67_2006315 [Cordylochernes scorpioides]
MERSLEQRYAIKFCVRLGKNATETYQMLQKAFKDDCISRSQFGKRHKTFKEGREELFPPPLMSPRDFNRAHVMDEQAASPNPAPFTVVSRKRRRTSVHTRSSTAQSCNTISSQKSANLSHNKLPAKRPPPAQEIKPRDRESRNHHPTPGVRRPARTNYLKKLTSSRVGGCDAGSTLPTSTASPASRANPNTAAEFIRGTNKMLRQTPKDGEVNV